MPQASSRGLTAVPRCRAHQVRFAAVTLTGFPGHRFWVKAVLAWLRNLQTEQVR